MFTQYEVTRIAICDDEMPFREKLTEILNDYANKNHINMGIDEFDDGLKLLNELAKRKIKNIPCFDLIILDYKMKYINGFETAKKIREYNYDCRIIFLSSYDYFVFDAYKVEPSRFLKKPLSKEKLYEALNNHIKILRSNAPIMIKEEGELIRIKSAEIIYIKISDGRCKIYLNDRVVKSSKTLDNLFLMLPQPYFNKIHRSTVINMNRIESIKGTVITMDNKDQVNISHYKKVEFMKELENFERNFYVAKTPKPVSINTQKDEPAHHT